MPLREQGHPHIQKLRILTGWTSNALFVDLAAMSYTQDEYREHVRLHVTNHAVVAHSVAPQASEVAGQGFSARVWIAKPADLLHIVQDAF